MPPNTNGWPEWGKYVLKSIERLDAKVGTLCENQTVLRSEIAALKVKAGVWGLCGGLVASIGAVLVMILKS